MVSCDVSVHVKWWTNVGWKTCICKSNIQKRIKSGFISEFCGEPGNKRARFFLGFRKTSENDARCTRRGMNGHVFSHVSRKCCKNTTCSRLVPLLCVMSLFNQFRSVYCCSRAWRRRRRRAAGAAITAFAPRCTPHGPAPTTGPITARGARCRRAGRPSTKKCKMYADGKLAYNLRITR